jgi:hypothetical protein
LIAGKQTLLILSSLFIFAIGVIFFTIPQISKARVLRNGMSYSALAHSRASKIWSSAVRYANLVLSLVSIRLTFLAMTTPRSESGLLPD